MLNIKRILFLFFLGIVINLIDVNLGNAQNVKLKDFPNLRDANGPDFVRFAIPRELLFFLFFLKKYKSNFN